MDRPPAPTAAAVPASLAVAEPARVPAPRAGTDADDRLADEVRDSLVLLLLSVLVTAGVAAAASGVISLLA